MRNMPEQFVDVAGAGACRHGFLWAAAAMSDQSSRSERVRFYRLCKNELAWLKRQLSQATDHPFYGASYRNELVAAMEMVRRLRRQHGCRTYSADGGSDAKD